MASLNKVMLIGNLGRDPEIRYTSDNSMAIANLSLATTRSYKNQAGQRIDETEWHRVVFFGKQAEVLQQYTKKGSSLYVEGRLRTRKYEKDGQTHYTTEIVGEVMQMLGSRQGAAAPGGYGQSDDGFEKPVAQSPYQPQARPAPRPVQQAAPVAPANGFDDDEDVPF